MWHEVCCKKNEGFAEGGVSRGKNLVFAGSGHVFIVLSRIDKR
jgi:hypothetical protein